MSTVVLPCANCDSDVPEGSSSCPTCGASLASVVISKEHRGLTRTLIGKAVELRKSIPWATPSAVVLLDDPDRPGKKKVRKGARNALGVALLTVAAGYFLWSHQKPVVVFEVVAAPPEIKPVGQSAAASGEQPPTATAEAQPAATPPVAEKPAPEAPLAPPKLADKATKPAAAQVGSRAAQKPGTLVVVARHKGKTVSNAVVRANGLNLGNTPVNAKVAPGRYTVRVSKAGFKMEKRSDVEVRPSRKQTLVVELKK